MEAFFRLESLEHYAMILMYASHVIGKTNALSHDQVSELLKIREKLGVAAGGVPLGAAVLSNHQDVLTNK